LDWLTKNQQQILQALDMTEIVANKKTV